MPGAIRITGVDVLQVGTTWRNLTLVKVLTDQGIVGWSDATVEYRESAVAAHFEVATRLAVGMDALAPALLWKRLVEEDFMAGDVVGYAAAGAVLNACLDIAGKALGTPVHRLLGGAIRERIPVYANGWYQGERSFERYAQLARSVLDRGHRSLKVDPFGASGLTAGFKEVDEGIALVAAVREAVGPATEILVDAHARFSPHAARRAARRLADLEVGFLEEPLAHASADGLRALRAHAAIAIAAGEHCFGRPGFRELIERDCVDVIQPDVSWAGGLLEVQRIAAWAETHGMLVALHNANSPLATVTASHLAAVLPNLLYLETFDDFEEPWLLEAFPGRLRVTDGAVEVPQAPGIGLTPVEELLREHPPRPVFMNLYEDGWERRRAELT